LKEGRKICSLGEIRRRRQERKRKGKAFNLECSEEKGREGGKTSDLWERKWVKERDFGGPVSKGKSAAEITSLFDGEGGLKKMKGGVTF